MNAILFGPMIGQCAVLNQWSTSIKYFGTQMQVLFCELTHWWWPKKATGNRGANGLSPGIDGAHRWGKSPSLYILYNVYNTTSYGRLNEHILVCRNFVWMYGVLYIPVWYVLYAHFKAGAYIQYTRIHYLVDVVMAALTLCEWAAFECNSREWAMRGRRRRVHQRDDDLFGNFVIQILLRSSPRVFVLCKVLECMWYLVNTYI